MNDDDRHDPLTARLATAARIENAALAALPLSEVMNELAEDIMRTPTPVTAEPAAAVPIRRPRHRLRLALAAAATVTAVFAGTTLIDMSGAGSPAFAAEAIAVAEANQRVLVDKAGWSVTRVDEFSVAEGEMKFSDGRHTLNLAWDPAELRANRVAKFSGEDGPPQKVSALGDEGVMFELGDGLAETMLPAHGGSYLRLRGDGGTELHRDLLAALYSADVETWLSALPPTAVKPGAQKSAVADMLRDIPTPPGFDPNRIGLGEGVRDRYQVGAFVTGAVTCGWVNSWNAAKASGDTAGVAAAADAMRTARSWAILEEMSADGAYPEVLYQTADYVATGDPGIARASDSPSDIRQAINSSLGCTERGEPIR